MRHVATIVAALFGASIGSVVAQTAVPTAPPMGGFFAAPATPLPAATPVARACPQAVVKGGAIVSQVGVPTKDGCDWSATIRFTPGEATLTFVSTAGIAMAEVQLGADHAGKYGGGIVAVKPNGDLVFRHARGVDNEVFVALDMTP